MCVLIHNSGKGSGCKDVIMVVKECSTTEKPKIVVLYNEEGRAEAERISGHFRDQGKTPEGQGIVRLTWEGW